MTDEPSQRTSLARDRTALAAAVVGAVLIKFGVDDAMTAEIAAGVVAFAAAATLGLRRRSRNLLRNRRRHRRRDCAADDRGRAQLTA